MTDSPLEQERGRGGQVVTFYSYKGGTGRTMALANVAWILASNGYRVLAVDWDLAAPGLHRFFAPFLDQSAHKQPGLVDMIRAYQWQAARTVDEEGRQALIAEHTRIRRYAICLRNWDFPGGGSLEFLPPGQENRDYAASISALDWDHFYAALDGGQFLDAMRDEMKAQYDYVLIDSGTGLSDVADICTVHLPDVLVDCFTLSTQAIEGSAQVAKSVGYRYRDRGIRILPVPMRVDPSQPERAEAGRIFAQRRFENLPAGMTAAKRRSYWYEVEVPYRPYYAFEETLAVFGDAPGVSGALLPAYERITSYITATR